MRILDRYIISEFLKVFALCLIGFVLLSLLIEITDKIKYYFKYNPPAWLMMKYFLVKIPGYLFFVLPLAVLMGAMLSLFMLARNSEIIAMQANGIDAISISRPVLIMGVIAGFIMFVTNETMIPWSNRYSEYIQDVEIAGQADRTFFKRDQIWMRSPGSITHIKKFVTANQTLEQITTVRWDDDYHFAERIHADKAKWWKDHWVLYGVNIARRSGDGRISAQNLPSMRGPFDKSPSDFGRVEHLAKEMNLVQLGAYINKIKEEGYLATRYIVDWHGKIAFPFVCLIMAALGVPFAVKANPRASGVAFGLAISVAVAFSFWIVHTLFIALGHGGYIPAIVAAWGATTIFGLSATMLLLHAGT